MTTRIWPFYWYWFWSFIDFFRFLWDRQQPWCDPHVYGFPRSFEAVWIGQDFAFGIVFSLSFWTNWCIYLPASRSAACADTAPPSTYNSGELFLPPQLPPRQSGEQSWTGHQSCSTFFVICKSTLHKFYTSNIVNLFLVDERHPQIRVTCLEILHQL